MSCEENESIKLFESTGEIQNNKKKEENNPEI